MLKVLFLISFCSVLKISFQIKCYECDDCPSMENFSQRNCTDSNACIVYKMNSKLLRNCLKISEKRNQCKMLNFGATPLLSCFCFEDYCNGNKIENTPQCYQCDGGCQNSLNRIAIQCPVGSNVCFSYFYDNLIRNMGCSIQSPGTEIINGKDKFAFCDSKFCNQNLSNPKTLPNPKRYSSDSSMINCETCHDCEANPEKNEFCLNSNGCLLGTIGNKIRKACAKMESPRNFCGHIKFDNEIIFGCFCTESFCNSWKKIQTLKCYICQNCSKNLEQYLKTCPIGAKGCFIENVYGQTKEMGCSIEYEGARLIGNALIRYCSGEGCNKNLFNTSSDPFKLVSCFECENCENPINKDKFCKSSNGCYVGIENGKIKRGCVYLPKSQNECRKQNLTDKSSLFGCFCNYDFCNYQKFPQTLQCYQCKNCIKPYDSYLKTCPPGALGCFKKLGKKVEELGCSIRSSGLLWEDSTYLYQYCSGSGCNLRGLVEE